MEGLPHDKQAGPRHPPLRCAYPSRATARHKAGDNEIVAGNRKFESISLQRRVCEPSVPPECRRPVTGSAGAPSPKRGPAHLSAGSPSAGCDNLPGKDAIVSRSYFTRLVRLSYLAPDITQAILDGRQPPEREKS